MLLKDCAYQGSILTCLPDLDARMQSKQKLSPSSRIND